MNEIIVAYTDSCYNQLLKFSKDIYIIDILYNQTDNNPRGVRAKVPVLNVEGYNILLSKGDVLVRKNDRVVLKRA